MAKKKKKKRNAASSVMSLITDEAPVPPPIPKTIVAPKPKPKPKPKLKLKKVRTRRKATCGVCGKANQMIVCSDYDDRWEDKGHPDHFAREVCVECISDYQSRDACAILVYDAMRKQLRTKEFSEHDIDQAVSIAWRTFNVAFDHQALVKMAKKLKVKHQWLKGKKSK